MSFSRVFIPRTKVVKEYITLISGTCYYGTMNAGCTTGAKRVPERFYMFKNRDLVYPDFRNHLIYDERVFAVAGINIADGSESGVSIGINSSGLALCSATVLINDDLPYDPLLEQILRDADSIGQAEEIVRESFDSGKHYQWCNIVIGSLAEVGVIEIGPEGYALERDDVFITRANHHLKLTTSEMVKNASKEAREAAGPLSDSQLRRQVASAMTKDAAALQDFISVVSTHSASKGFDSICRHLDAPSANGEYLGQTAYSYIIEIQEATHHSCEIVFYVSRGNPCSSTFQEFPVDFELPDAAKDSTISRFP
jgi:hypothetical protein